MLEAIGPTMTYTYWLHAVTMTNYGSGTPSSRRPDQITTELSF